MPNSDLGALFEPRTVAIVGATPDTARLGGGVVLDYLQRYGFGGTIYPVNPKYQEVMGLRCYPELTAVPGEIDVAILSVPAKALGGVIASLTPGKLRNAVVLTSGFSELGEEGKRLELELIAQARAKKLRVIGPNSVGIANLSNGLVPSISQFFDRGRARPGPIALISQSGAFGTAILAQAERAGVRFGYFISSGNEADLEFSDFGRYLVERDDVQIVCGYIESIRDGQAFIDLAKRARELGKPIVVLKVGTSDIGAAAARSHTGALVGSDEVAQAVFDAHGVLRATDGENLLDLLSILSRTPAAKGERLAVLSHSGGAAVLAADAAAFAGATLPPLPEDLRLDLQSRLPAFAAVRNPLDMTGGASLNAKLMADCLRSVLADDGFDAALLCVNLIWRDGPALVQELNALSQDCPKPFAVSWVAPDPAIAELLKEARFPVFGDPARAARALSCRLRHDRKLHDARSAAADTGAGRPPVRAKADLASIAGQAAMLARYGVRLPRETLARSLDEAVSFLDAVGGPVAVKIASPDIAHRTELGAVATGIADPTALAEAYERILANVRGKAPDARIEGMLVQEMIDDGVEVLVGLKRDPVFGPIIAVGPGGTLVELLKSVRLHPVPVSSDEARRLIDTSTVAPLLQGFRGRRRLDAASLAETLVAVSRLAVDRPEIVELDLNPVFVLPDGCIAVDFAMTVSQDDDYTAERDAVSPKAPGE